jgi:hypothetical protein
MKISENNGWRSEMAAEIRQYVKPKYQAEMAAAKNNGNGEKAWQ